MMDTTLDRVKQTPTESTVTGGCIVYAVHTGQAFCVNASGLRMLRRLEQGLDVRLLEKPGVQSFVTLLDHAQAIERGDRQLQLRAGAIRVFPYDENAQYLDRPMSVMLEVTPACDLRCIYCCVAEIDDRVMGRMLNPADMIAVADEIGHMGVGSVTITGGEPFMRQRSHGDLFDIIHRLRAHNVRVNLFTNGTMLADYAQQILDSGVAQISISLDGSTPELFEQLTRRPSFDQVVAGLQAVAHHGIYLQVAMVVTRLNAHDWPNMIELVRGLGLDALEMLRAYPIGRACKDPSFIVDAAQWAEIARAVFAYARSKGYSPGGGRELENNVMYPFGNCKAGTTFCLVNYDGSVCPCMGFKARSIGNLRQRSLGEVWASPKWDRLRSKQFTCPVPDRDVLVVSMHNFRQPSEAIA